MAEQVAFEVVAIDKPDDVNVIVGQAHFIKTVEDIYELSPLQQGILFHCLDEPQRGRTG